MTNILVNFNAIKIRRIPKTLWACNLQSTLRFLSTKSVRLSTVQGNMDCIKYFFQMRRIVRVKWRREHSRKASDFWVGR